MPDEPVPDEPTAPSPRCPRCASATSDDPETPWLRLEEVESSWIYRTLGLFSAYRVNYEARQKAR
jgi:hypothetical protein